MNQDESETAAAIFDSNELVARCMGNIDLAERVLAKFQSGFEADLAELEQAVLAHNADLTASIAHRLRGASASAAAHLLSNRMAAIEQLAHKKMLSEIQCHLELLPGECRRFSEHAVLFH